MGVTLDLFRNETEGLEFPAGQTIFTAGAAGSEMFVILKGEVELFIGDEIVEVLGPGEPFGEMALIDRAPRVATARARTSCTLTAIPEKRFLFMVQQTPHFALQIMRVIVVRLRKMDTRR